MNFSTIIFKIRRRIIVFFTKIFFKYNFKCSNEEIEYHLTSSYYDFKKFCKSFYYLDERSKYISNLIEYLDSIFKKKPLTFPIDKKYADRYKITNNKIIIKSDVKNNNWTCFYLDIPKSRNYEVVYEVTPLSFLEEIQIAFNYQDLGNRYRFMIHNNSEIVFETVYRGVFYNKIFQKDYKINLGEKYKIKLVVFENNYIFYVNDVLIFNILDKNELIDGEKICLIFYNGKDVDNVNIELNSFNLNTCEIINKK